MVGTDVAAKAEPDGYTLVMISSTHATNESLAPNKPFQLMRDFVAVAPMVSTDLVMVVHPSVPVKDLREFIALAKAKPGALNYASSGLGSNYHMAAELFKVMSGTDMVHVPYTGSAGARNDIIGGQVQMMFDSIPTMAPLILAGNVKALATTGTERSPILPGVPTLAEAGLPAYQATTWIGLMAPAGTPKPIVDLLNAEANKILSAPELRKSWAAQGANAMSMTPAEFDAYIRAEIDKWAEVVKISGVKIN
jgi:tripartite-type tricarboxylate transporter receptor subunit TctC